MSKHLSLWIGLFFTFFMVDSYAIKVSVQSPSNQVYALGFRLNGKDYGGAGKYYSTASVPPGMYTFGIRVGGLVIGAKDVGCPYKGSKSVMLSHDTTAVLSYNGQSCSTRIFTSTK